MKTRRMPKKRMTPSRTKYRRFAQAAPVHTNTGELPKLGSSSCERLMHWGKWQMAGYWVVGECSVAAMISRHCSLRTGTGCLGGQIGSSPIRRAETSSRSGIESL